MSFFCICTKHFVLFVVRMSNMMGSGAGGGAGGAAGIFQA